MLLPRFQPMEDAGVVPAVVGDISERSVDVAPKLGVRDNRDEELIDPAGAGIAEVPARSSFSELFQAGIPGREELEALREIPRGMPLAFGAPAVVWTALPSGIGRGRVKGAGT